MSETNGDAFSDAIDSMWIYISNIHSNLNYFSARPEGTFKTISFGLKPSTNRTAVSSTHLSGTEDHFQIRFWIAVGACILLMVLGMLAGLAPAYRAMAIKPIEAIRDE